MKSTTPIHELTAAARAGLSGSWGKSIGVMIVYALLLTGVSHILFIGRILQLVFMAPLIVGLNMWFLKTVRKQRNPFSLLFAGFDHFGTAWCAHMLVTLIILVWMIPFIVMGISAYFYVHPNPATFPGYTRIALYVLIGLLAAVVLVPLQMRYGLVLFVVADEEPVRARQALRQGVYLMKGNYGRLALLWLRFIGWQLLCIPTLGLGLFRLAPYMSAATAAFYDDLVRNR